jgi:hypothetical protein
MPTQRVFTIVAQDPSVQVRGRILTAQVTLPEENLGAGPRGHRAYVVDYDASTHTLMAAAPAGTEQPTRRWSNREILDDPCFHSRNVFAIAMRILTRFEQALGRRMPWAFDGHQIKIAPHAFLGSNAYYSRQAEALLFGYFPSSSGQRIYTCLSHDVVAHEVTHALLDGLRQRYSEPSIPDQAAFHEGFADVVSALSVFSLPEVMDVALPGQPGRSGWQLNESILLRIGKQIGQERGAQGGSLRRPASLKPGRRMLGQRDYQSPHARGEALAAAILHSFLDMWKAESGAYRRGGAEERNKVVALGASIADQLLTLAIRAIDYTPPVDIRFGDYLSALLTASYETAPEERSFAFRPALRRAFRAFGIEPTARPNGPEPGVWGGPGETFHYRGVHADLLGRDTNEVFKFLWENRHTLRLDEDAYTRVLSVRPCLRVGPDGLARREAVADYVQVLPLTAAELAKRPAPVDVPPDLPLGEKVTLLSGGALLFDEYGGLRHHIHHSIDDARRQSERLRSLWLAGYFDPERRR